MGGNSNAENAFFLLLFIIGGVLAVGLLVKYGWDFIDAVKAGMGDDEKDCPFCGETIKSVAVKCRFCGSELSK